MILPTPNESLFRFCFVEKNRIDSFSRIAAQAPAKQTELIATLFGLETFAEFVRNFTSEVAGQYIDLYGQLAFRLAQNNKGYKGRISRYKQSAFELRENNHRRVNTGQQLQTWYQL